VNEKGKGKGNGKGKGIIEQTPGGDDISRAIALQLHRQMSQAGLDTEGWLEWVYSEPQASAAGSISSDNDTDSTESDGRYDSEYDPDVDMCLEDAVNAPDCVVLDGDLDMERDSDDVEEEDDELEDMVEEDEEEEEDVDEDEDDG